MASLAVEVHGRRPERANPPLRRTRSERDISGGPRPFSGRICHQLSSPALRARIVASSRIIRLRSRGEAPWRRRHPVFRSRRRLGIAAALLVSLCAAACSSGSAAPQPQQLTLWSGIAAEFTNDLIQRFNSALPQTHIDLQTTSGGVVVVSAVDGGQGQLGLAQSDVVYLAYRRGIERNLYPHKNLRAIAVLWVNNLYVLVRRDSPFRSIRDLKGRPRRRHPAGNVRRVLDADPAGRLRHELRRRAADLRADRQDRARSSGWARSTRCSARSRSC